VIGSQDVERLPTASVVRTARAMAVDQVTAEVVEAMGLRGIAPILLKGPAIARWLYPEGGRSYRDTDLLVGPAEFANAGAVLVDLGFATDGQGWAARPASTYQRQDPKSNQPFWVDLHRTLPYAQAPSAQVWSVLRADTGEMTVGGTTVAVLAPPARLVHVALHAAQHGIGVSQPLDDLRRAVATVDTGSWHEAVEVARRLGAEDCVSAGLILLPEGRALAAELGLTKDIRPILRTSTRVNAAGWALQELADASSLRERIAIVHDLLFPTSVAMLRISPWARRGRISLALAYLGRLVRLPWRLVQALKVRRSDRGLR